MRKILWKAFTIAAGVLAVQDTARANLIVNGGFEESSISLTGWTVPSPGGGGTVGVDGIFPNTDDHDALFLSSSFINTTSTFASISQTFSTTPGGNYTVEFYLNATGATANLFQAMINNVTMKTVTNTSDPLGIYTKYSFSFTATSSTATLSFRGSTDGKDFLDDVDVFDPPPASLDPVPEPATIAVFGILAFGAIGYGRRKRAVA